jgi:putative transposase
MDSREKMRYLLFNRNRDTTERGLPKAITVDNGSEFYSRALDAWAYRHGVQPDSSGPESP